MEKKRIARVGPHQVDIGEVVRDPRGIEDLVIEILEHDFVESRYAQFGAWLSILPDAADIGDWDRALLERYPPLYTMPQVVCCDCDLGPCHVEKAAGKCGLTMAAFQGRLSLGKACRGCLGQMVASRRLLDQALKVWGESHPVSMGEVLTMSDACPPVGTLSGIYVKNLKDLHRVLSYGEAQLAKLTSAGCSGTGTVADFESMVMHAGSVLLMAMGYQVLSMSSANLPKVKAVIRQLSFSELTSIADQACQLGDTFAVQSFLESALERPELSALLHPAGVQVVN